MIFPKYHHLTCTPKKAAGRIIVRTAVVQSLSASHSGICVAAKQEQLCANASAKRLSRLGNFDQHSSRQDSFLGQLGKVDEANGDVDEEMLGDCKIRTASHVLAFPCSEQHPWLGIQCC